MPWQKVVEIDHTEMGFEQKRAEVQSKAGNQYYVVIPECLNSKSEAKDWEWAFVEFDRPDAFVTNFAITGEPWKGSIPNKASEYDIAEEPENRTQSVDHFAPDTAIQTRKWLEQKLEDGGWEIESKIKPDDGDNWLADIIAESEIGRIGFVVCHRTKAGEGGLFGNEFRRISRLRQKRFDGEKLDFWCFCASYPTTNNPMKKPEGSDFMKFFMNEYGLGYLDANRNYNRRVPRITFVQSDNTMKIPINREDWSGGKYEMDLKSIKERYLRKQPF